MDIVEMIKACKSDEELKELAEAAIEVFTEQANRENNNNGYIGTKLDINPINNHLDDPTFKVEEYYEAKPIWNGYIPLGTKIVYGRKFNDTYRTSSHEGFYYYVDDDSYIYEFFKFIKNYEIEDDFDIIIAVGEFLDKKLTKHINFRNRDDIDRLINKTDNLFFRPNKEHSIKDFYNNGSARCSEIALLAENIISALGLEIMYFGDIGHTYNIYAHHEEDKTSVYVLDYSDWVGCYDVNHNYIGHAPYFAEIENADRETANAIVNDGKRVVLDDYFIYVINGSAYRFSNGKKRVYGTDYAIEEEKKLILKGND